MPNKHLAYAVYGSIWAGLDLIFPPVCGGCEKLGSQWCVECQPRVHVLRGTRCEVGGRPLDQATICSNCLADKPHFRALRAWSVHEDPVKNARHPLKNRRDMAFGDVLAQHMIPFVIGLNWHIDTIVPLPHGAQKYKERSYNQVGMIARPLSLALGLEYTPKTLIRCKETRSQVGLTRQARVENVKEAFEVRPAVGGKNILVLDDVSTTGSTLSASAKALYLSGAKDVFALTVARALPHHGLRQV